MSDWSFISHVTDYMARPRLGDQKAPTQWPSEATAVVKDEDGEELVLGKCRRQAFFRLLLDSYEFSDEYNIYSKFVEHIKTVKQPVDKYMRWIWAQGELYEEHCINLSKESGVFFSTQTPIYIPEYNVSGKIDLVAINPSTGERHIVEFKSVYSFGGTAVLGTDVQRRKGELGAPKDSNIMQIGLYQHWYGNKEEFGDGLLVYGDRGSGKFAEYTVTVEEQEDGENYICYSGRAPNQTKKIVTPISIENILGNYRYIAGCVDSGEVPKRDFDISYSEEKLQKLFDKGKLSKADTERFAKRAAQIAEGKKRIIKQVEKGDWQCRWCSYASVCYNADGSPTDV